MRAVDAGAVHSGEHEVFDMRRVFGGVLRQRDEDAGLATGRPGTEHRLGMTVQHVLAKPKVLALRPQRFAVRVADQLQIGDDRVQGRHHAALATGQTKRRPRAPAPPAPAGGRYGARPRSAPDSRRSRENRRAEASAPTGASAPRLPRPRCRECASVRSTALWDRRPACAPTREDVPKQCGGRYDMGVTVGARTQRKPSGSR